MSQIKLFSGTAHPQLAKEVCQALNIPLSKSETIRFLDSEVRVTIQEDVKDNTCVVIQPTSNPSDGHLMELCFFADALKRQEAQKVVAIIPYFGYSRQNAQHRPGECVSLHVVVKFLEAAGFDEIWTFDFHEIAATGIFSVPFSNIFAFDILAKHVKHFLGSTSHLKNTVIVAPDQEGIERARIFGKSFYGTESFETATVSKQRNLDSLHQSKALELFGDVKDKTAILVDDICTSGGTLIHAAEKCLEKGAKRIFAVITHPDFIDGVQEKIQASPFEKFFTTNTIPFKKNAKFDKLIEVSIAETIASKLKHV